MWRDIIWTSQNWLRIRFLYKLGVKHIYSCVRICKPWHHWANSNLTGIYECTNHSPEEGMFQEILRKRSECKYSGLGDCFLRVFCRDWNPIVSGLQVWWSSRSGLHAGKVIFTGMVRHSGERNKTGSIRRWTSLNSTWPRKTGHLWNYRLPEVNYYRL